MAMGPLVSVVIPTYNRLGDLRKCLGAMERQTLPADEFEVIVVDGGSSDGTLEFLESLAGSASFRMEYCIEKKRGAAAARNVGVLKSAAKFIAFTDDDCIPSATWLSELLSSFPPDEKCAAVGGRVSSQGKNIVSRYVDYCRISRSIIFGSRAVHLATTNALYRRSALLGVGIFDERIIIGEDLNLSQKILRKGYYLKPLDAAEILHRDPNDVFALYKKAWLHGTGVATVARIEGRAPDFGPVALLKSIMSPSSYIQKFVKKGKLALHEEIAFALLHRVQILGMFRGYAHGLKSHISSR